MYHRLCASEAIIVGALDRGDVQMRMKSEGVRSWSDLCSKSHASTVVATASS